MDFKRIKKKSPSANSSISHVRKEAQLQQRRIQLSKNKSNSKPRPKIQTTSKKNLSAEAPISPKPIDYAKVMKKFGLKINSNSNRKEKFNTINKNTEALSNLNINTTIQNDIKESSIKDFETFDVNNSMTNKIDPTYNSPSHPLIDMNLTPIKDTSLFNIQTDEQHIKNEIQKLQTEINTIKQQSLNTKNKVSIFIKLIRKYAHKLLSLSQGLTSSCSGNLLNKILGEISSTINQFYNMIYNPKLNESVFDISAVINTDEFPEDVPNEFFQTSGNGFTTQDNIGKEVNNLIKKYEGQNMLLKTELANQQTSYKEIENKYSYLSKIKNEMENKIDLLERENCDYKKEVNELNDKLENLDVFRRKIATLENDLKYKDSVILYLENSIKNSTSFSKSKKYYDKFDEDEFEDMKSVSYDVTYSRNTRQGEIKREIDDLDEEILELKTRLKNMLKSK